MIRPAKGGETGPAQNFSDQLIVEEWLACLTVIRKLLLICQSNIIGSGIVDREGEDHISVKNNQLIEQIIRVDWKQPHVLGRIVDRTENEMVVPALG